MKWVERTVGNACIVVFGLLLAPMSFTGQIKDATKAAVKKAPNKTGNQAQKKPGTAAPRPALQKEPRGPVAAPEGGRAGGGGVQQTSGRGAPGAGAPATQPRGPAGPVYHGAAGAQPISHTDGSKEYRAGPNTIHTDAGGHVTRIERPGTVATGFGPDGRAAHIEHTRADGSRMTVDRGARGERRIENVRPGGVRVVAQGRGGFVERPVRPGYVARTYVAGGRTRVFVYRGYAYRGIPYYRYVPRVYFAAAFYGWAYRPWGVQVAYAWGWGPSPLWFFGGYFAPAPYYTDPALWMTDNLMAEDLQAAYADQQASDAPPPPTVSTSPDQIQVMKQMVADEVRQQVQADQNAAAQPAQPAAAPSPEPVAAQPAPAAPEAPPPALDPSQRTFVVSASIDVTANGENCALTGGDIIYRSGELQNDGKVGVTILSSKPGDCKANSGTAVELAALQDMQNQFREQIAGGMETLAAKQGQGGIPPGPAANPTQVAEGQATPAPDAQTLLAQLNQEADQSESQVKQAAIGGTPTAAAPRRVLCSTCKGVALTSARSLPDSPPVWAVVRRREGAGE